MGSTNFSSPVTSRKGFYGPKYAYPVSVGAIGDSITSNCMPNVNMQAYIDNSIPTSAVSSLLPPAQAQAWAIQDRRHSWSSWLLHGAMRSKRSWFPFEFMVGGGGYTSEKILSICLPTLLNNPYYGLPDMCVVLAGTNDISQSVPVTTTISNIKTICQRLSDAGIVPIIASCPPPLNSQGATIAVNMENLVLLQCRLARELGVPFADFYTALVSPMTGSYNLENNNSSNSYCISTTDLHPSPVGAAMMGYVLNQTIQDYCLLQNRLMPCIFDSASIAYQNRNPGFTSIYTGSANTTGTYPSAYGANTFSANPNAPTVYNTAGTEPGGRRTMNLPVPQISGIQNYQGNSFCLQGDATNTTSITISSDGFASFNDSKIYSPRDKLALSFRLRSSFVMNTANAANIELFVQSASNNKPMFGIAQLSYNQGKQIVGVGNETGYDAGDVYLEYTIQPEMATGYWMGIYILFGLGGQSGGAVTDSANYGCIANLQLINLTRGGLVAP